MHEGRIISWYTNVYDLKAARLLLFRNGDFTRAVVIDLKKELEKGKRELDMKELVESAAAPYPLSERTDVKNPRPQTPAAPRTS